MIFEQRKTCDLLRGMVRRLSPEQALKEDLIQQGIIHLWLREKERPGQKQSWYIQSCRLHLQNFLRKGRSVDGSKRPRAARLRFESETHEEPEAGMAESPLSLVCARDLLAELAKWLTPCERQILALAHDGFSLREIGERLDLSHTSILRHRRSIAALALRLEAVVPRVNGKARANGQSKEVSSPNLDHQIHRKQRTRPDRKEQ